MPSCKDFLPAGTRPHALFADSDWKRTLVHLYSFSEVYALTGYRGGAVTCATPLMAEIEKAMDYVSICPPRLGQEAALNGQRHLAGWARRNTEALARRAGPFRDRLARSNRWRLVSIGAYFAYVEHPYDGKPSAEVSKWLADTHNLLTIPGSMFGAGQDRLIRFAFANVGDAMVPPIFDRLEQAT